MRRFSLLLAILSGCARPAPHISVEGAVLGRVVIYRNGVAFYERTAHVTDGQVSVHVPRDRVDDFLKSLTVVDPSTRKPLAVSIPRQEGDGFLTMTLDTVGHQNGDVLLTYVTESPAWKPSYRVVVGDQGKVMLEGWAIVDNVSGEDWKNVLVGVGASSALSFRYDLWSVRHIDRDLLQGESRFAVAPPAGMSPYEQAAPTEEIANFSGATSVENTYYVDGINTTSVPGSVGETITITGSAPIIDQGSETTGITIQPDMRKNLPAGRTFESVLGSAAGAQSDGGSTSSRPAPRPDPLAGVASRVLKNRQDVVIENTYTTDTQANVIKNKLVDQGIPAERIHVRNKSSATERGVRVLAVASTAPPTTNTQTPDTPVGESHFMADRPMSVRAGSSAMVAMVHGETAGGVVYLYDPISDRGDDRFAFKAVRLDNPTDDTLEPGPITVYGAGRFIGEGITEPVPPKASVVVPFASDRQVMISKRDSDEDKIAKLMTAARGVVRAEIQHRKQTRFTITSRLPHPAKIFLRHRLEENWKLVESPPRHMQIGDSTLFEVDLEAGQTKYVTIAEATPVEKTLDLTSSAGLDMMKVFIDEPAASPDLKKQIAALLEINGHAADLTDKIATLRDQLAEYRTRANELHAQVVTLKAVRTGGTLVSELKAKLGETSDRIQRATLDIVDTQEQLMMTRVKFQNQLAELHLSDMTAAR